MENAGVKIQKRGDVFLMTMLAGENRFNNTFLKHLNEAFDFLEKYANLRSPFASHGLINGNIHTATLK